MQLLLVGKACSGRGRQRGKRKCGRTGHVRQWGSDSPVPVASTRSLCSWLAALPYRLTFDVLGNIIENMKPNLRDKRWVARHGQAA